MISRFAKDLRKIVYIGFKEKREDMQEEIREKKFDLLITTYEV